MFQKVTPAQAKNEAGVLVDYSERYFVLYVDGDKSLKIPTERLIRKDPSKPTDTIFLNRVSRWESPHQDEVLTLEKRTEVKLNVTEALLLLDCRPTFAS